MGAKDDNAKNINVVDHVTAVAQEACQCRHLAEYLPHLLDLELYKTVGSSSSKGGWVVANPVHAMHLTSQMEDPSAVANNGNSTTSTTANLGLFASRTPLLLYGEEQQRMEALSTAGVPEYWSPLDARASLLPTLTDSDDEDDEPIVPPSVPYPKLVVPSSSSLSSSAPKSVAATTTTTAIKTSTTETGSDTQKGDMVVVVSSSPSSTAVKQEGSQSALPSTASKKEEDKDDPPILPKAPVAVNSASANPAKEEGQKADAMDGVTATSPEKPPVSASSGPPDPKAEEAKEDAQIKMTPSAVPVPSKSSEDGGNNKPPQQQNRPVAVTSSSGETKPNVVPSSSSTTTTTTTTTPAPDTAQSNNTIDPTPLQTQKNLLSDDRYLTLKLEEDRIRLVRRSLAQKRAAAKKKVPAKDAKKRKTSETTKTASLTGWRPKDAEDISETEREAWAEAALQARQTVEQWMDTYRLNRRAHVEETTICREVSSKKAGSFYLSPADLHGTDRRRCESCAKKPKSSKRVVDCAGDELMQCLGCSFIGCAPKSIAPSSRQHINKHLLLSGHNFGKSCRYRWFHT